MTTRENRRASPCIQTSPRPFLRITTEPHRCPSTLWSSGQMGSSHKWSQCNSHHPAAIPTRPAPRAQRLQPVSWPSSSKMSTAANLLVDLVKQRLPSVYFWNNQCDWTKHKVVDSLNEWSDSEHILCYISMSLATAPVLMTRQILDCPDSGLHVDLVKQWIPHVLLLINHSDRTKHEIVDSWNKMNDYRHILCSSLLSKAAATSLVT